MSFVEHGAYDPSTSKTPRDLAAHTFHTLSPTPHNPGCGLGGVVHPGRHFTSAPQFFPGPPCPCLRALHLCQPQRPAPPACPHGHHSTLWCLRGVGVGAAACLPRGHDSAGRSGGDGIGAPTAHCILTLYSSHVLSHKRTVLPRQLRQRGGRGAWVFCIGQHGVRGCDGIGAMPWEHATPTPIPWLPFRVPGL